MVRLDYESFIKSSDELTLQKESNESYMSLVTDHLQGVPPKTPFVYEKYRRQSSINNQENEMIINGLPSASSSGRTLKEKIGLTPFPRSSDVQRDIDGYKLDSCAFRLGQHVVVDDDGKRKGILRFYGRVQFQDGLWAGIECYHPVGKNNGSVDGVRYFHCPDNHGIFVGVHRIRGNENTNGDFQYQPHIRMDVSMKMEEDESSLMLSSPTQAHLRRNPSKWHNLLNLDSHIYSTNDLQNLPTSVLMIDGNKTADDLFDKNEDIGGEENNTLKEGISVNLSRRLSLSDLQMPVLYQHESLDKIHNSNVETFSSPIDHRMRQLSLKLAAAKSKKKALKDQKVIQSLKNEIDEMTFLPQDENSSIVIEKSQILVQSTDDVVVNKPSGETQTFPEQNKYDYPPGTPPSTALNSSAGLKKLSPPDPLLEESPRRYLQLHTTRSPVHKTVTSSNMSSTPLRPANDDNLPETTIRHLQDLLLEKEAFISSLQKNRIRQLDFNGELISKSSLNINADPSDNHEDLVAALQKNKLLLNSLVKEKESLLKDRRILEEDMHQLHLQVERLQANLTEVSIEKKNLSDLMISKVSSLENHLEDRDNQLSSALDRLVEMQEREIALSRSLIDSEERLKQLQSDNDTIQFTHKSLQEKFDQTQRALSEAVSTATIQEDYWKNSISTLQEQISAVTTYKDSLALQFDSLKKKLDQKTQELANIQPTLALAQSLQVKLSEEEQAIQKFKEDVESKEAQLLHLNIQLSSTKKQLSSLAESKHSLEAKLHHLLLEYDSQQQTVILLKDELACVKQEWLDEKQILTEKIILITDRSNDLQNQISQLRSAKTSMERMHLQQSQELDISHRETVQSLYRKIQEDESGKYYMTSLLTFLRESLKRNIFTWISSGSNVQLSNESRVSPSYSSTLPSEPDITTTEIEEEIAAIKAHISLKSLELANLFDLKSFSHFDTAMSATDLTRLPKLDVSSTS